MTTTEVALVESRALRASLSTRTEALDKIKALVLLPDGAHVTTRMVADYFEVSVEAIKHLVKRHREELAGCGYILLQGTDLQEFLRSNLDLRRVPGRGLGLFPRRAVLNVAMLLRDSDVARRVRIYLLDSEEEARARRFRADCSLEAHVEDIATRAAERYCSSFGSQLTEMRGLLEAQTRVVCAMSVRLAEVQQDVSELRRDRGLPQRQRPQRHRRRR